jgi:ATP-binding protein involved in chromosome partitioning
VQANPPGVKHVIAVGSGKGGVGKSTVTVNLALALAAMGHKVGVLDGDIYGPSVPFLMGVADRKPSVMNEKLVPIEAHGVKVMSMGFLLPSADEPVVWRGPMLAGAMRQFFQDVNWGEIDYLLVDLPPGTGDIPLSLVQLVPLSGAVIVLTPQPVAAAIGTKTLRMLQQTKAPILGIVENMSHFVCGSCGTETDIFDRGGGREVAEREGVPFLGEVPLDPAIRASGDRGTPVSVSAPDGPHAEAFRRIAQAMAARLAEVTAAGAR